MLVCVLCGWDRGAHFLPSATQQLSEPSVLPEELTPADRRVKQEGICVTRDTAVLER